jgi:hypothetical protein
METCLDNQPVRAGEIPVCHSISPGAAVASGKPLIAPGCSGKSQAAPGCPKLEVMQEQGPWIAVIFAILRASESTLSTIWNTQSVSNDHLRQTLNLLGETLDRKKLHGGHTQDVFRHPKGASKEQQITLGFL